MVVSSVIEKGWDAVQQGAESVGINPRSGFLDDNGSRAIPVGHDYGRNGIQRRPAISGGQRGGN